MTLPIPRSWLFVPGDSPRKIEKALASGADAMILDLEDAVGPPAKDGARRIVAEVLASRAPEADRSLPRIAVRVNGFGTPWLPDDLAATTPHRPDWVMLPKAEGPEDVDRLARVAEGADRTQDGIGILVVATETPSAVTSLLSRSWAHPQLRALLWGGEDLSAALGAARSRDPAGRYDPTIGLARNACLYGARIAGVAAIDAVYTDFRNADGLREEAETAHVSGFDGKAAIHPDQVEIIHRAFADSADAIAWAQAVRAAMAVAPSGVAVVDGQMIDAPHLARAERILARLGAGRRGRDDRQSSP